MKGQFWRERRQLGEFAAVLVDEDQISLSLGKGFQHLAGGAGLYAEGDLGIALYEVAEQLGQDHGAQRIGGQETEMTADGWGLLHTLDGFKEFLLQLDHFFGKIQHLIAFFGQGDCL